MQFLLKGLYTHNGLLYFHTDICNNTDMPYNVDFITFKVVDKKVAKLLPFRNASCNRSGHTIR